MRDFPGGPVVWTLPSITGDAGLIPGQGAKIPHASQPKNQNIKQERYYNEFSKDFKNCPHQKQPLKMIKMSICHRTTLLLNIQPTETSMCLIKTGSRFTYQALLLIIPN